MRLPEVLALACPHCLGIIQVGWRVDVEANGDFTAHITYADVQAAAAGHVCGEVLEELAHIADGLDYAHDHSRPRSTP